jgi:hypothetical protein
MKINKGNNIFISKQEYKGHEFDSIKNFADKKNFLIKDSLDDFSK